MVDRRGARSHHVLMSVFQKYDPNFRVETWSLGQPEIIAGAESFTIAEAAFVAACAYMPKSEITLRHGARVLRRHEPKSPAQGRASQAC